MFLNSLEHNLVNNSAAKEDRETPDDQPLAGSSEAYVSTTSLREKNIGREQQRLINYPLTKREEKDVSFHSASTEGSFVYLMMSSCV